MNNSNLPNRISVINFSSLKTSFLKSSIFSYKVKQSNKQDILPKDLICLYPILILQKKWGQVVLFKKKNVKINHTNTKEILLYNKKDKKNGRKFIHLKDISIISVWVYT